nr:uncharacterized protein LOC120345879 isoform X2 [Styela clava]
MSTSQQKRINDYMKLRKRIPAKSKEKRQRNKKAPNTKPEPFASDTSISDTRNAQTERDMKILRMFDLDPSFGPSVGKRKYLLKLVSIFYFPYGRDSYSK